MRRFTLSRTALPFGVAAAVAAFGTVALTGCEDGPTQTFQPAPATAAGTWNGAGDAASSTDPATQGYTQQQTGQNAQVLCTGMEREAMFGWALKQPIVLPNAGGGLDLSGGPTWRGLTINQAQIPARDSSGNLIIPPPPCGVDADGGPTACGICQGDALGNEFGDNDEVLGWGDSDEIWMHYPPSTLIGNFLVFFQGYLGQVSMKSRPGGRFGTHTYAIPIITAQVQRDNGPFTINWKGPQTPTDWRNELNDALVATFAPGLPEDPDCNASRSCIQGSFGDVAYLYMTSIGFAIWTPNQNAPQPTPSLMNRLDVYVAKVLPFAYAAPMLEMTQAGPLTVPVLEGTATTPCSLNFGSTYGQFLANCVNVSGNSSEDTTEQNKLLGGILHDTETFSFNVQGVDLNFGKANLGATAVVSDSDRPSAGDPAVSFSVDQSTLGRIANDYPNNDPITNLTADLHGSGLVYLEYAELVQSQINALMVAAGGTTSTGAAWPNHQLGDAACTGLDAHGNPLTDLEIAEAGCTGFEGMVNVLPSSAMPAGATALGVGPTSGAASFGLGGLKPGHHTVTFCDDVLATGGGAPDLVNGFKSCAATGDTFPASLARVQKIVGYRGLGTLPPSLQDARFFFQQWFKALVGYLEVADSITSAAMPGAIGMVDTSTAALDQYDLFNDSIGAGQFEIAEYVDRRFTTFTQPPLDLVFTADVKNGIMNSYQFSRYNYRGESSIYTSMIDHRGATATPVPRIVCSTDSDCGGAASGIVCNLAACEAGCRGTGGNACNQGTCSSTDATVGQCVADVPPGAQDTALLSNMFGSLALHTAYPGFTVSLEGGFTDNTSYDGYYCATTLDRQNCCTKLADGVTCNESTIVTPPLDTGACEAAGTPLTSCDLILKDQYGRPLLAAYEGAFGTSQTAWTLGFPSASSSLFTPVAVNQTFNDIQAAQITVPLHSNPYDFSSGPPVINGTSVASIQTLVPWAPKQPGIGFPVAVDGTRDLFVETYQLDLSGTTVTANIDYDFTVDTSTHLVTTQINFEAVETTDFLGDLFICQDPTTKDLLAVHMYTSVSDVLTWFSSHPGAYAACGMITRYSPYGNYADYITTSNNGVRLGITQGGGYGRVVDGTEWATNLVTIPPQ
jgi:hypothetical protein